MTELARLVLLVHAGADDPKTGEKACMPVQRKKALGLGSVWDNMKTTGSRKAELAAKLPAGFDLDAFIQSQKRPEKEYTKDDQMTELARLVLLVHTGADDPKTGEKARMPIPREKTLGIGGVWDKMKTKGCRKADLAAKLPTGFDLDAFILSQKRPEKEYTKEEQMTELARLVLLVHTGADDPLTGEKACMPIQKENALGLGIVWDSMKRKGCRKADLTAELPAGFGLDAFILSQKMPARQEKEYTKEEQMTELARLVILVHTGADDTLTGEKACMPISTEEKLGLGGVWRNMKQTGNRKAELAEKLPTGFDLDAFILSQKMPEKEYSKEEQVTELARLVLLVHAAADDPLTGNKARMPIRTEKKLGLGCVWENMKNKGRRKAELAANLPVGFNIDAFIESQKRK
eukprot:542174-Prymnesium_polylepis.1